MLNELLPLWIRTLERSDIQKALETTSNPEIISFSLGRPDDELLKLAELCNYEELLSPKSLQYSPPLNELKVHIAELMKERQVLCTPEQVFLTTGAQQAMTLLTKLLATEGDNILVDQVTYPGFIQVAQAMHLNLLSIPVCFQQGIQIKDLKKLLKENSQPSLLYTMSDGHNPLGNSLSKEQRIELTKLTLEYKVPIIEDDAYGFLNYDPVPPPLKFYWEGGVFYIGSFAKILAPSLRVGWIIAPESIIEKLKILKEGIDINTSTLSQSFIHSFFTKGKFTEHIAKIKETYKTKRDLMVHALQEHIPELEFTTPKSGFFIWGKLPSSINTTRLFKFALAEEKVSFLPESAFLTGVRNDAQRCLRLSFAFCPIEMIEAGVKRLSKAIKNYK